MIVFGTRPEAVKLAPLVRECYRRHDAITPFVCLTGQHREMLAQVTDYFEIEAHANLDVMTPNQSLASLTSRCIEGIDGMLQRFSPDCVVVQGDTTTVMCGGLAAFYRRIPVVHVEAGLRTGRLDAPWPEEMNRRVTSAVTTIHCAPTRHAAMNLIREGHAESSVHITGNTVIDSLLWTIEREQHRDTWRRKYAFLEDRRMVLITGHRRENFGQGLRNICEAVVTLCGLFPLVQFVYPVHLNPNVQDAVKQSLSSWRNVHLIDSVPYPEFVWLMNRSTLILTDSGGVQEEAPSLKVPVLLMRETTERPEAVEAGAVEFVGASAPRIIERCTHLLTDAEEYARHQIQDNPYGDGHAASRIVDVMLKQDWQQQRDQSDCSSEFLKVSLG